MRDPRKTPNAYAHRGCRFSCMGYRAHRGYVVYDAAITAKEMAETLAAISSEQAGNAHGLGSKLPHRAQCAQSHQRQAQEIVLRTRCPTGRHPALR